MTAPAHIPAPIALRCPKCAGDMVTYERSGIHLDQCRECRGFFLDRGELEKLVDAEGGAWMGPTPGVPAQATHAAPAPVPPAGYPGMPQGYPGMPQGYPGMPQGRGAQPQPAGTTTATVAAPARSGTMTTTTTAMTAGGSTPVARPGGRRRSGRSSATCSRASASSGRQPQPVAGLRRRRPASNPHLPVGGAACPVLTLTGAPGAGAAPSILAQPLGASCAE